MNTDPGCTGDALEELCCVAAIDFRKPGGADVGICCVTAIEFLNRRGGDTKASKDDGGGGMLPLGFLTLTFFFLLVGDIEVTSPAIDIFDPLT